jgi:hypothetical protein
MRRVSFVYLNFIHLGYVLIIRFFTIIMPTSLSCLGCKSTKFSTRRGLAKHRSECNPFKRLQKKKLTELALHAEEELPLTGDVDFGDIEDVNMEQNIDEPEPLARVRLLYPLLTRIHNS